MRLNTFILNYGHKVLKMSVLIDKNLEFDIKALGQTIKAIRNRRNLYQADFAQALSQIIGMDISRQKVSRWEEGKNEPSASELVAIARFQSEAIAFAVVVPTSRSSPRSHH